jgi:hypothetical protein
MREIKPAGASRGRRQSDHRWRERRPRIKTGSTRTHIRLAYACVLCLLLPRSSVLLLLCMLSAAAADHIIILLLYCVSLSWPAGASITIAIFSKLRIHHGLTPPSSRLY